MKTKALLFFSISLATALGQSDIPDTGLGPPPRFGETALTSVSQAVLVSQIPPASVPTGTVTMSGVATILNHRAVGQGRTYLDFNIFSVLPDGITPTIVRVQRGVAGTTGSIVLEIPVSPQTSQGIFQTTVASTPDNVRALTEIADHPERFYLDLYTSPSGFIRGQLSAATQTVLMGVMSPANEVPAVTGFNASAIAGVTTVITRDTNGTINSAQVNFDVFYQFASPVVVSGLIIQSGAAGTNGPVVLNSDLRVSPVGTPVPQASGNIRYQTQMDVTRPGVMAALEGLAVDPSKYYLNLRTTDNPNGALRAQLRPTESVTYQLGYGVERFTGDLRIADAARTLNVIRAETGEIQGAVNTIDVDYDAYPPNLKFTKDLTGPTATTGPTGTGNFYSMATVPPNNLAAVDAILRHGRACLDLSTEDNIPTSCRDPGDPTGHLQINAIISAASDPAIRTAAPGEVIALYGTFPGQPSNGGLVDQPWPLALNGLEVTIGGEVANGATITSGRRAPLAFVSRNQINVQVPFEVPSGSQPVRFWNRNPYPLSAGPFYSAAYSLQISAAAPAIFLGEGGPQIYNANGTQNTPDNAAAAGDVLTIYATGLGQTNPPLVTGHPAPDNPASVAGVIIAIGPVEAATTSAQPAPGQIGIYTVTFSVPAGVPAGSRALTLRVQGQTSKAVNVWFR